MKDISYTQKQEQLYRLWHNIWEKAYKTEFDIHDKLNSDYFLSQDIIIGLRDEKGYFALITLKYFDLTFSFVHDNSYFNIWTEDSLLKMAQLGKRYFSCGNLSVIDSYRGIKVFGHFPIKDILFSIVREYFVRTSVDGVISNTRNAKSVHSSAYRTGAFSLKRDIDFKIKGQKVDLLMWHQNFLGAYEDNRLQTIALDLITNSNLNNNNTEQEGNYVTNIF
jgi:hypothetical protein